MLKLQNLDEAIAKLKTFLPQYLTEHGVDTEKNFQCWNPDHEDSTSSMSCKQNPDNAWCYGCCQTMDIFLAAHWKENKPLSGPGFIEETIQYLAQKYGVEVQLAEMTEDDLYRHRTYCAYKDAAALIANKSFGNYTKLNLEIIRRGWSVDIDKVGTVNYKEFRSSLKTMGYDLKFQDEVDLSRADIFSEDNMIFTICDEFGRPVGFAARNLSYDGQNGAKYMNQKTTGLRCNIYQKGKRLYELHTALKHTPPLYIFEGYTDVLTAQNAGLINCCAIGGTAFTSQHIQLLKQLGVYDIIIALDGDEPGKKRTRDILDDYLAGHKDLTIEILNLPENLDPDDFIRQKGLVEFNNLKKWSAFEWRLNQYIDSDDPEKICGVMVPLIINESSCIKQDKACGELSKFTGIDKKIIVAELERQQNDRSQQKHREKEDIIERMVYEIKRNPADTKSLLYTSISQIELIDEKYDENSFSVETCLSFLQEQKKIEESLTGEFAGFILSDTGLGQLGDNLNGNWRQDVFMCFGGAANSGKTAMTLQMGFEIASNPKNDACVIYHTIDDNKEQILPRLVCQAYGGLDLTINQVRNPNYYLKYDEQGSVMMQHRKTGYDALVQLINDGRIILKDVVDGASFSYGENLIRYYQNKYPDRQIVYILDNLHKTPDYEAMEPRMRFKTLSNQIKGIATRYHVPIIATVEYTKLPPGTIPTNTNIAETRAIIYDANFIGHLYNDLHEMGSAAVCIHNFNEQILPRVRLGIGKNKITEFKDRIFLDFFPASSMFKRVSTTSVELEMIARKGNLMGKKAARNSTFTGTDGDSTTQAVKQYNGT